MGDRLLRRTICKYNFETMKEKIEHVGKFDNPYQAMMLGNGNIGSLCYGDKELKFSLDLASLWDERPEPELKENYTYPNMLYCMKNDWNEYLRLFDGSYLHSYPSKINAGTLVFSREVLNDDRFTINLNSPKLELVSRKGNLEAICFATVPVLLLSVPLKERYTFLPPLYLTKAETQGGLGYKEGHFETDGQFRAYIQPMYENKIYFVLFLEKEEKDGRKIFITIGTGLKEDVETGKKLLLQVAKNESQYRKEHQEYWSRYWATSDLYIPETKLMHLYDVCRYFFACNSHGSYPMALQGVWTKNDGTLPPWHGDYHNDINLEMSYESYLKNGNFKEGKVLCDYLWDRRDIWKSFARDFAKTDGYLIPGVMSQSGIPLGGWPMYALSPNCTIWLSKCFDDYYRYTMDRDFLQNRAYPFFQEIEKSVHELLRPDQDGCLTYGWSSSPEINDCNKNAILPQSNWELSLLHYLYETLLYFEKELGISSSYYAETQKQLRPYVRDKDGAMLIAPGLPYSESHRHFSHLLMEKNLGLLTPEHDLDQLLKDLAKLTKYGTAEWVGFSFTEMAQFCAYALDGKRAISYLEAFEDGFIETNGFHMNMDFRHKGYSSISSYAFTLDANIGFIKACNDLCLYSHNKAIAIFPNAPEEWKREGAYFRLHAEDALEVEGSYDKQKLSFQIATPKATTIQLYNNLGNDFDLWIDGKCQHYSNPLGTFFPVSFQKTLEYGE